MRKKLPPRSAVAVNQLIEQLGALRHQDREAAERELAAHGWDLLPLFEQAIGKADSKEVQVRLRRLMAKARPTDRDRLVGSVLQVLELCGTPDAVSLLREYAAGTAGTRLTDDA